MLIGFGILFEEWNIIFYDFFVVDFGLDECILLISIDNLCIVFFSQDFVLVDVEIFGCFGWI